MNALIKIILLGFLPLCSTAAGLHLSDYTGTCYRAFAVDRKNDRPILIHNVKPGRVYSIFIQKKIEFSASPKDIFLDFSEHNFKIKQLSPKVIMISSIKINDQNEGFIMFTLKNHSDTRAEYEVTVTSNEKMIFKELEYQESEKRYIEESKKLAIKRKKIFAAIKSMENKQPSFIKYNINTGDVTLGIDFAMLYEAFFLSEFYLNEIEKINSFSS
ncbi:MAG: hypothetical protein HRT87_12720 [Legionellales bacterium]|nr:hypothetical protein [Legionellales bacterium]